MGLTTPPHNIEAEMALLGSILIDPETLGEIHLPAAAFYITRHGWAWDVYRHLQSSGMAIDLLTVQEELDRRQQLQEFGGPAYLTRLATLVPSAFNAPSYAKYVHEAHQRRLLLESASEVAKLAYNIGTDIETVKTESIKAVSSAIEGGLSDSLKTVTVAAGSLMDKVSEGTLSVNLLQTGLEPLDANIGGLDIDTLTILAGRPGMSKTSFLLQVADLVSDRGEVVAFFSKEMSLDQCLLRIACRRARVSPQSLRNGQASWDDRQMVAQWLGEITNRATLFIDERKQQTTDEVRAECKKLERRMGHIALVIGDHLRLFMDDGDEKNEVLRLGKVSRGFKIIAGELHTRSLLAAQMNRGSEGRDDKRPMLQDLRGSGQIEEDADNVLGLFRPNYYDKSSDDKTVEILSLKLRDGNIMDDTEMNFEPSYMSFVRKIQ
jgi:replicative DNA helicase